MRLLHVARLGLIATFIALACHERPTEVATHPPASITVVSGGSQSASVGTQLPTTPVFLVADSASRPVSGAAVAFEVAYGGGTIPLASVVTDSRGMASPGSWTLGSTPGLNVLVASVAGSSISAQVNAVGIATPVTLSIASDSILYAGTFHQQSLIVDSTALVAVRQNGKTYLYYAGLGSSPTTLSDSVSALSLSRHIAALIAMVSSAALVRRANSSSQSSEVVAGVQINTPDDQSYAFFNTEGRMVALKFTPSPSSNSPVFLAPHVDVATSLLEGLFPSQGIVPAQYGRTLAAPTTLEVFGSIMPIVTYAPELLPLFWGQNGSALLAAIQADPTLFARINIYDLEWILISTLNDELGVIPCVNIVSPATVDALGNQFLSYIGAQQDPAVYKAGLVRTGVSSLEGVGSCACLVLTGGACATVDGVVSALELGLEGIGHFKDALQIAFTAPYATTVVGPAPAPVWSDDFEAYQPGSWPTQWIQDGNATDTTTNFTDGSVHYAGTRSLRLYGVLNACWGGLAYRPLTGAPPYDVEVAVRNGDETLSGCHPYRALVQLRQCCTWTNPARALAIVTKDGMLQSYAGDSLATLQPLTWYQLRLRYEITSTSQVTVYYWLDGRYLGSETSPQLAAEASLQHLDLEVGEGTAWFDNVTVAH